MNIEAGRKKRLLISFSGGKTSAYMTKHILEMEHGYDEILVVFANTGMEHQKTLDFVDRCDKEWGFQVQWLESIPSNEGASTFKVVDYETASTNGVPFEQMIQKYGIPNMSWPHCTRELKQNPIHKYVRSLGWTSYDTALGIRADEIRRVSRGGPWNLIYPLVDWFPVDKVDVNIWWEQQDFTLEIPEHLGNCVMCWKKSGKKLAMANRDEPWAFEWTREMERKYGHVGPHDQRRVFFRGNLDTDALIATTAVFLNQMSFDIDREDESGCTESCEPFVEVT